MPSPRTTLSARLLTLAAVPLLLAGCAGGGAGEAADASVEPAPPASAAPQAGAADDAAGADAGPETAVPASAAVQEQLDYVLAHWSDYNDEYGTVTGTDCVNFTSQSLLARGWLEDDEWYYGEESVWDSSPAWVSSTAMRDYLEGRSDVVPLDDTQRDQVALGDIVQFDWDGSGDRDHTGIVTKIEYTDSGTVIYFAGHTLDSDYRSVDHAITVEHPGGSVYYWHITE